MQKLKAVPIKYTNSLLDMAGFETYKVGDWKLQSGQTIPDAEIAYKTFGDQTSPAIIYPTWFSGCMFTLVSHKPMLTLRSDCRQRMADWRESCLEPKEVLHYYYRHVWKWPIDLTLELRYKTVSASQFLRQCTCPALTCDRTPWHKARPGRHWMEHGRRADVPVGN